MSTITNERKTTKTTTGIDTNRAATKIYEFLCFKIVTDN